MGQALSNSVHRLNALKKTLKHCKHLLLLHLPVIKVALEIEMSYSNTFYQNEILVFMCILWQLDHPIQWKPDCCWIFYFSWLFVILVYKTSETGRLARKTQVKYVHSTEMPSLYVQITSPVDTQSEVSLANMLPVMIIVKKSNGCDDTICYWLK